MARKDLEPNASRLIEKRAANSEANRKAWHHAAERFQSLGLDASNLMRAVQFAPDPGFLNRLSQLIAEEELEPEKVWAGLETHLRESNADEADFWKALALLVRWADDQSVRLKLASSLGYLHCCSLAEPNDRLSETVPVMLREYGFRAD
jgi:hypothetical protein